MASFIFMYNFITVVFAGVTELIKRQAKGYSYIKVSNIAHDERMFLIVSR